jgi:hypothetical protein
MPALTSFTISAFDGVGFSQTFLQATDSAADIALVPDLCGPRSYVILEAAPNAFMSIVPPAAGTEFTSPWTINALSNAFTDVGVWPTTVQVTLDNYGLTTTFALTAEVLDPCLGTIIQPVALANMFVSIYDTTPQVQPVCAADDSFSLLMATPGICGDKTYLSD